MSIKSNRPIARTTMAAATDTTVVNPGTSHRFMVNNLYCHDSDGGGATVNLYLSADAASAAGERIQQLVLAANETKQFNPVAVAAGLYLIMQTAADNVNFHGSYTDYDGGDV